MLLLVSTTDKIQVITSAALDVHVQASWVDNASGVITPGRTNTVISTATTTDVVASPAASTARNVKQLTARAKGGANTITVQHTDGTTVVELLSAALNAGDQLVFTDGYGFEVLDSTGQLRQVGAIGLTGAAGAQGLSNPSMVRGDDGDDGPPGLGLVSGMMTRAALGKDAKGWSFLGTTSGTATTVGPLIWTGQFQQIYFEYIIGGYNGGTPVGRLLCGSASISTTALTNGNNLSENDVNNATSVSVPGCPLAVTLSAIARTGHGFIRGASGALKQIEIIGNSGNPAVATSPAQFSARSYFSDLGTNLLLQRLQLTVYDTLTATAASAQTFTATTQLWAWGRNSD